MYTATCHYKQLQPQLFEALHYKKISWSDEIKHNKM